MRADTPPLQAPADEQLERIGQQIWSDRRWLMEKGSAVEKRGSLSFH